MEHGGALKANRAFFADWRNAGFGPEKARQDDAVAVGEISGGLGRGAFNGRRSRKIFPARTRGLPRR
jgi:hypothetical protein